MPVPPDWSNQLRSYVDEWRNNPDAEEYIGDGPFENFVLIEQAESWAHFERWLDDLQGRWCFRGQREATWLLLTSLDRAARRERSSQTKRSSYHVIYHLPRHAETRDLLFRFQQQTHLYQDNLPSTGDWASWLALMQHHGAPTLFMDWTNSPYVAAYFAFEENAREQKKSQRKRKSAIWAIDLEWLEKRGLELLQSKVTLPTSDDLAVRAEWINGLLAQGGTDQAVVVRVDPPKNNERMAAQQGVFLCRLFYEAPLTGTLMRMMIQQIPDRPVIRKLELNTAYRIEFLQKLKAMNIHRASLFPGLDGFAQALKTDLELKDVD